jgi:hypothetical protein
MKLPVLTPTGASRVSAASHMPCGPQAKIPLPSGEEGVKVDNHLAPNTRSSS